MQRLGIIFKAEKLSVLSIDVHVVVNFYFQLNFSFNLLLCMLMYADVNKSKGKLKFNWKEN